MHNIRTILREDYACRTCGAKRGDYCRTLQEHHSVETDSHQDRWNQYYDDRRRRFATDISPTRLAQFRQHKLQAQMAGPDDSIIDRHMQAEPFRPQRNDSVAEWLKRRRDSLVNGSFGWDAIDRLLDDYRLHADTGTPLEFHVSEGDHDGDV